MMSWILFGKIPDSKKNSADWWVLFWGFSVFRWKITPMVKRRPKGRSEAERKRKRDEEREDDVTMSERHQVSDWFLLLQKTIGTRMFTQKERRYLCADCVEIVVSVMILWKMLGTFEWICYLWGAHTWYFRTFKLVRIWVHSVYPVVEPHKCHKGFCGVKGLPPPCSVWMIGILHVPLKMKETSGLSKGKSHENLGQLQGDLFLACLLYHGQMGGSSSSREDVPKMQAGWFHEKTLEIYDICI